MLLLKVASPIILTIGIVGNLVSFCIFRSDKMKHLPTFKFLSYLSLIDCLYILIGIPHIMAITFFNYDFRNTTNLICSIHSFLTIYLSHLSSNVLAAIGVFRCAELMSTKSISSKIINEISTKRKKQKSDKITIYAENDLSIKQRLFSCCGKVELILFIILFVLFVFNSHYLIFMRLRVDILLSTNTTLVYVCYPFNETDGYYFDFYTKMWPLMDLFLYSYIPFIVMLSSTIVIIYKLCKANKSFKRKHEQETIANENQTDRLSITIIRNRSNTLKRSRIISDTSRRRAKRNNQVYKLLLSLNATFFLLVTPIVMFNSFRLLDKRNEYILELVYILAYLNHCLNFIFYGLTCELFRIVLVNKLKKYFKYFFLKK